MTNLKKSSVLIVDDVASQRNVLEYILSPLDITIIQASSGKDALSKVLNNDFAVILMDIEMPGMKGYEVVSLIHSHQQFKHIPIVMVTSNDNNSEALHKSYEAGAVDFVTKPVNDTILTHKVAQFIALDEHRRIAEDSTARLNILLNSVSEGILGIDLNGQITFANPKASELLGIDAEKITGKLQDFLVFHDENTNESQLYCDSNRELSDLLASSFYNATRLDRTSIKGSGDWRTKSGGKFHSDYSCDVTRDPNSNIDGAVLTFKDTTQEQETAKKLLHLANFDYLTNISNRAYFHDTLKNSIVRVKRSNATLAVMFLDIDHFKFINDQYGHDVGDLLLQTISQKLSNVLREDDLISRMGGDEFAIILQDIPAKINVINVAQKILDSVCEPLELNGIKIEVSTSIGIAFYDPDSMNMDDLLKAADTAMYEAKSEGRNNFQFFAKPMQDKAEQNQRVQMLLSKAILNNELTILYQPKISLLQKKMVGCEALIRWYPEEGSMIPPDIFIPIAEQTGQIIELGEWILDQVCQQISHWQTLPYFEGMVTAVNVSVRQLGTSEFREKLSEAMKSHAILPEHVEIEVTETATFDDHKVFFSELDKIHDLGVKISIDDFGTGHSSLDYLRKMPVDIIKIDRSFIKDIGMDEQDEELIRTILAISKTMSIQVIAEGAETVEQLTFLEKNHVDSIQGYYFSKPIPAQSISDLLNSKDNAYTEQFERFESHKAADAS
jgi:diguanylate cyclase (GGDEF)-like protein/PAS domain S-box-containing protein